MTNTPVCAIMIIVKEKELTTMKGNAYRKAIHGFNSNKSAKAKSKRKVRENGKRECKLS